MVILLQCSDRVGLVAEIAAIMAAENLNIISMKEFVNVDENRFYIRVEIQGSPNLEQLQTAIKKKLPEDTEISLRPYNKKKIAVLVTKEHHCLGDILLRNYFNTLGAEVQCVIGNYSALQPLTEKFDIPFHHIAHEGKDKHVFEQEMLETLSQYEFDYIVLAKFMRILSPNFIARYPSQIINIHHSFLPAFIGAHPYKQAHERGVKLIGATAHFVTNVLDDGPIIAQQTIAVNHAHSVKDMMRLGREIEKSVLANALQFTFQDRVLLYHNKTIVFEN
ncbi:formyltetrahydrofolate deformylase [Niabella insulamsoli]|uniref:formyltetrahydrofolate deformylase n=1 Tax=Niabella insulamsoli TaxID=3144874 RepID=UPI0031FCFD55